MRLIILDPIGITGFITYHRPQRIKGDRGTREWLIRMVKGTKRRIEEEIVQEEEELHEELLDEAEKKSRRRRRGPYRKSSVGGRTRL